MPNSVIILLYRMGTLTSRPLPYIVSRDGGLGEKTMHLQAVISDVQQAPCVSVCLFRNV